MIEGFGLTKEDPIYGEYVNKWVVIAPYSASRTFSGRLRGFRHGDAILNPFYGGVEIDPMKGVIYGLVKKDSRVSLNVPLSIEETSEENILNLASFVNRRNELELKVEGNAVSKKQGS